METVLLIGAIAAANILCFMIGAKVGQTVSKGEPVKLPEVNPVKAFQAHQAAQDQKREQDRLSVIMENLESYDGTGTGQKEVPRG